MIDSKSKQAEIRFLSGYRRVQLWVILFGPIAFAVGCLVFGLIHQHNYGVLIGLGLYFALLSWTMVGVLRSLKSRIAAVREVPKRLRMTPRRQAKLGAAMVLGTFLFLVLVVGLIDPGTVSFLPYSDVFIAWLPSGPPFLPELAAIVASVIVLLMGIACSVFAQYYASTSEETLTEASGLARWFRGGTLLSVLSAATMGARGFGSPFGEQPFALVLYCLAALLAVEMFLRGVSAVFLEGYKRKAYRGARVRSDLFSLKFLFSRFSPIGSVFAVMADVFGIDIKGTWALTFIRRSLLPIGAGLVLAGWLWTSVVMVNPDEQGVRESFGRRASEVPMEPGLHFVWPWPINTVQRVAVHRVQSLPIGFERQKAGASMLWTIEHADEEFKLLVGDGRDLVTVNATLHFKVSNIFDYLYHYADPKEQLNSIANRALMGNTVSRSLDDVLSENSEKLANALRDDIVQECLDRRLGIEIVDLTLSGLHPPVAIASDYQAVVSAQIEMQTLVVNAEAYREEELPKAKADAYRQSAEADAFEVTRLSTAKGEATGFLALLRSYEIAPVLFMLRHYLVALEELLEGKSFHVLDQRIEGDGGAIWILDS